MKVELIDPAGFKHVIEFSNGNVYGHENIAHVFPTHPKELRIQVTNRFLRLMQESKGGDIDGFRWERIE